jgi:raffinose/stachyose/melibiose transport system permease protein
VVFPILKPTMISVGVLETMWVWNDYLLPTLVLDIKKYKHHPHADPVFPRQLRPGGDGPMMACIMLTILPVVMVYLLGQKHIIKGVVAGAVKG